MAYTIDDYKDLDLLSHHAAMLAASAISPEVAKARGYWTAQKKSQLRFLGFGEQQSLTPSLVIPIHRANGQVTLHQVRPDRPRANSEGKLIKYETPTKFRLALDIPPSVRLHLTNPRRALFITEGSKKADSAVSHGLCCIDVLGVWNFRGMNDDGGKTILADWEYIDLKEREVYIVRTYAL